MKATTTSAPPPNPLRAYAAVTMAYWTFMLSDGALRMLVLLHFNSLGFTPVQLAWLCGEKCASHRRLATAFPRGC